MTASFRPDLLQKPASSPLRPQLFTVNNLFGLAVLAIVGTITSAHAQIAGNEKTVEGPAPAPAVEKQAVRNGYGETLTPKVRRKGAASQGLYTPIKKQDDAGQIPEIEMFVGESRVFPAPGVARIAVGNGQIMTAAALEEKEVIVFANAVGTSSLFVWNADGRYQRVKINVAPGDTNRIAREVAAFLTTIPHTKASIVGDKVIVEGEDLADADQEKIAVLAKRYPQIVNFTSTVGWEQMVMMDVKVVEFPRNELRELGLKWNPTGGGAIGAIWGPGSRGDSSNRQINIISGQSNPAPITAIGGTGPVSLPSSLTILSAFNLGINAQLNLLEQNGTASILAEPQLSTRSGSKASFLAGGEFPYTVSTINGVSVFYKPYGIKLDVEPKISRNGVIRALIESEVSAVDPSINSVGGPGLLTRKTKAEFNVRNGETIVLSGLLQRTSSTDIDKIPGLGDVPILGALFRSKRFQNKETELVVFVTPTIVDSRSPGLVDRVQKTTDRLTETLGKTPYLSDPLQPGRDAGKFNQPNPPMPVLPNSGKSGGVGDQPGIAPAPTSIPSANAVAMPVTQIAPIRTTDHTGLVPPSQNPLQPDRPAKLAANHSMSGSSLKVIRDGLVIRELPTSTSTALLELGRDAVVEMGSAEPKLKGQVLWRNVVVGQINGWVIAKGVTPVSMETSGSVAQGSIASRDQNGKILTLGANGLGTATPVAEMKTLTATSNTNMPVAPAVLTRYQVILPNLGLHVSPDINALVTQKLAAGQLVEALPQPATGNWIAVKTGESTGWMARQWLQQVSQ